MGNSCISIFANKKTKSPSQAFTYQQHIGTHMPRCTSFMPHHVTILTHAPHNDGDSSTRSFFFWPPTTLSFANVFSCNRYQPSSSYVADHWHLLSPTCPNLSHMFWPNYILHSKVTHNNSSYSHSVPTYHPHFI